MDNLFHFIFGLNENFNDKPFDFFHYLNIKSCYLTQNNPTIYVHCIFEPKNNIWWEKIREFVTIIIYKQLPDIVYKCNNKNVWRIEHQSDILRLLILKQHGGVYADVDTLFYKPFFPTFSDKKFVMGLESMYFIQDDCIQINGLCNALIISDKDSEFLDIWLNEYNNEYDEYSWDKMSIKKPYELSKKYTDLIHIENVCSFHKYNWNHLFYVDCNDEMYKFYTQYMTDNGIFSKHMAESQIYKILKSIDYNYFKMNNSLYSKMCKNINGLIE